MEFFCRILLQGRGQKESLGLCAGCGWKQKRVIGDFSEDKGFEGFGFVLGLRVQLNPTVPVRTSTLV
jgi:hypothetical protein